MVKLRGIYKLSPDKMWLIQKYESKPSGILPSSLDKPSLSQVKKMFESI
jgi:hypothetical protein